MTPEIPEWICEEVLLLAKAAGLSGEVPVGAAVCEAVDGTWNIIGSGKNEILQKNNAAAHAEMSAIQSACDCKKSERLTGCILVTTLEPCLMCSGALILARIETVCYFAPVFTGIGLCEVLEYCSAQAPGKINHVPVATKVTEWSERSSALIQNFFISRRQ